MDVRATVESKLSQVGVPVVARVVEFNRATDVAIGLARAAMGVIRCAERAETDDQIALATMVHEGDFNWAGLVFGECEGFEIAGAIETFHVSELDRLVARLLELREAYRDPG